MRNALKIVKPMRRRCKKGHGLRERKSPHKTLGAARRDKKKGVLEGWVF